MSAVLQIRSWTSDEFANSRELWQRVLATSDADPLFMSWDWQWRWWTHHAEYLGATLRLLGLYDGAGELVGIAPFYSRRVRRRGWPALRRLELIGLAWRDGDAVFSEYLDLIVARGHDEAVMARVARWLEKESHWDDLALPCLKAGSLARRLANERLRGFARVREVEPMTAYAAALPRTFEEYAQGLTSNARRKLLNQRRKLRGPVLLAAAGPEVDGAMETLRAFEAQRWGAKSDRLYAFNCDLATFLAAAGELRLTRLVADGRTISVMYSVRRGSTEYYLQSAFDPQASQGLSLGYLHFGYAIEEACRAGVTRFDFLAGEGRHRDYKQDLLTERSPLICCHVIRVSWLRALHRLREIAHSWRPARVPTAAGQRAARVA